MDCKITKRILLLICLASFACINQASAGCYDKRTPDVDWSGCKKTNKMLDDSNFNGASFIKINLTRSTLTSTKFYKSDLSKAVGYRANFDEAVVKESNMTKSEFSRASFKDAELTDVDWSKSELGRVDFTGARLNRVNFEFSNLSRVRFTDARITEVNFKGAYTFRTRFEDVDLRGTLNLHQLHLKLACGNENTQLPEGLSMPDNWPCTE